jgi:hypothetical protein
VREYKEKSSAKLKELRTQRAQMKVMLAEQAALHSKEKDELVARLQRYVGTIAGQSRRTVSWRCGQFIC